MKIIYIKFLHKNDVFAIRPTFDLIPPGELCPSRICPKCNESLYIPIEIAKNEFSISMPMGAIYKPFPLERPDLITVSEPELPFLSCKKSLSYFEQQRLKQFNSVCYVDDNGFEMLIGDCSLTQTAHICDTENMRQEERCK